jgi:DNA recombination protein Rad52
MESPFTPEIRKELEKPLDNTRLKHRQGGGGMTLNYLAGYDVIATANKLIGFGNWGYNIEMVEPQTVLGDQGEIIGTYYVARIQLAIKDCIPITEEGVCAVQAGRNPKAIIDSHDMARKGAITDALKRAFRCYGDQFGNSLYDKDYDASTSPESQRQQPTTMPTRAAMTPHAARPTNLPAQPQNAPQNATARPVTAPAAPIAAPTDAPATEQQREAILRMAGRKGVDEIELEDRLQKLYGSNILTLTRNDAAHFIKVFQGQ